MDYNKESLNKLVEEIIGTKDITLMEIPCVDLYMDQVTTFFNEKLGVERSVIRIKACR